MTAHASSDVNARLDAQPHYRQHPSGVPQIEIAELLPYNLGSALKYVWRHEHKGDPSGDLEKALYHLDRELLRTLSEKSDAERMLGLGHGYGTISERVRITDRMRRMQAFIKEKEFVAEVAELFCVYKVADARVLIVQHLKNYQKESP